MSTWRRKAQELYPPLAGQLETWERTDWNFAFSKILSNAVASEQVAALAEGVRYLQWCWSQHTADEQFVYFVETTLRHLLERPSDRAALCRVADDRTFTAVLAMYSHFLKESTATVTGLTPRSSGRVRDKVPFAIPGVRAAQLNR